MVPDDEVGAPVGHLLSQGGLPVVGRVGVFLPPMGVDDNHVGQRLRLFDAGLDLLLLCGVQDHHLRPFRQVQTVCHFSHANEGESKTIYFLDPDVLVIRLIFVDPGDQRLRMGFPLLQRRQNSLFPLVQHVVVSLIENGETEIQHLLLQFHRRVEAGVIRRLIDGRDDRLLIDHG